MTLSVVLALGCPPDPIQATAFLGEISFEFWPSAMFRGAAVNSILLGLSTKFDVNSPTRSLVCDKFELSEFTGVFGLDTAAPLVGTAASAKLL